MPRSAQRRFWPWVEDFGCPLCEPPFRMAGGPPAAESSAGGVRWH
jgi:hypothetical protein